MLTKDKNDLYQQIENHLSSMGEQPVIPPAGVSASYLTSSGSYNIFSSEPLATFGNMDIRVEMHHLPFELKEYIHRQVLHAVSHIIDSQQTWEEFTAEYKRKLDEMLLGDEIAG